MKRFVLLSFALGIFFAGVVVLQPLVKAETNSPMTAAHIARIRANCVDAQTSLQQLHASDALLRVNRGQVYELITTKLMAPMNSRIALNRLDSATLVSITADYEKQLNAFRMSYKEYEEAMSKTLKIECTDQPVAFYDAVKDTRTKRHKVHETTTTLQKTIKNYKTAFDAFAKTVKKEQE